MKTIFRHNWWYAVKIAARLTLLRRIARSFARLRRIPYLVTGCMLFVERGCMFSSLPFLSHFQKIPSTGATPCVDSFCSAENVFQLERARVQTCQGKGNRYAIDCSEALGSSRAFHSSGFESCPPFVSPELHLSFRLAALPLPEPTRVQVLHMWAARGVYNETHGGEKPDLEKEPKQNT